MKRVTGLGGVFFKSADPERLRSWYQQHLGLQVDPYGTSFIWRRPDAPDHAGRTQWSPFPHTTDYFSPSDKQFMINYRVADLAALLEVLRAEGVHVVGEIQRFEYGAFAHVMDCDGNKIELWEPPEEPFPDAPAEGLTF